MEIGTGIKSINSAYNPILDKNNESIGVQIIAHDITERKRAEAERRRLFDLPTSLIMIANPDATIGRVSAGWATTLGYSLEEMVGRSFLDFIHPDDVPISIEERENVTGGKILPYFENRYRHKDGTYRVFGWTGIADPETGLHYGVAQDITERKHAEEQIKASLKEKEVLLREIHHRVKNNMQVISSLLKLQANKVKDERLTEALMESQGRVQAMATVHETLYDSDSLASIDLQSYISNITKTIFQSSETSRNRVTLKIEAEDIKFGIEQATPISLLINELVSNALKHAFPENRNGHIIIQFQAVDPGAIELMVSDNGIGLPEDLDWRNTDTLGLKLITILAENQLNGTVNLNRKNGTHFTIRFKPKETG